MDRLRTFGIVAHIDAGKTTLTERMLFDAGAQGWVGSVDEGTAAMDWMPAERSRGISITAAATRISWAGHVLQIVDTPGHVDFVAEVERCLRVIDGVVVLVDGVRGVESQTRAVWQQSVAAGLPRLVFVNKLDRVGADFDAVLVELAEQLECDVVPLVVPLLDEAGAFAGLGDALTGSVQWFEGRPAAALVPALREALRAAHDRVVEIAADLDDAILAEVVAGRPVEPARIQRTLRRAFLAGALTPVLCGAALYNRGVDWLLDAVVAFLPGVSDVPRKGLWSVPGAGREEGPFCGLVFKVQHLDEVWNYVRVVRGRMVVGEPLVRAGRGPASARVAAALWSVRADRPESVASAGPGEIVVVPGELGWRTGDTVCDPAQPVTLPAPRFPVPVLAVTFEPAMADQGGKLFATVRDLAVDDPTLRVAREHDRIVVRGMGELHLEIVADLTRTRSGVEFRVSRPRVDRRETVARSGTGAAELRAMVAGEERIARCAITIGPVPDLVPAEVVVDVPSEAAAPVVEEVRQRLLAGTRVGPFVGVVVRVLEARGPADAEALVQQAASKAFDAAVAEAGLVALEPWVAFEVLTPTASSAAVLADLGARRAEVASVTASRLGARLSGRAPLARMLGYVTRLRSISKGLGQVSLRPAGFAPEGESGRPDGSN